MPYYSNLNYYIHIGNLTNSMYKNNNNTYYKVIFGGDTRRLFLFSSREVEDEHSSLPKVNEERR
jgi:hypothetical protein